MTGKSITAYSDLQFGPIAPDSPVEVAMLWGDPETGPAAVLVRFPEGYEEPWHSHSSTYRAILVKGEFQLRGKGDDDSMQLFGPGSYVVQPGGAAHREVNGGTGEMVAFVFFDGPIDFSPAD